MRTSQLFSKIFKSMSTNFLHKFNTSYYIVFFYHLVSFKFKTNSCPNLKQFKLNFFSLFY